MNVTQMLLKKYPDNKDKDFERINEELKKFDATEEAKKMDRKIKWNIN